MSQGAEPSPAPHAVADAEKRITPRTKAIMPVHLYGHIGDLDSVYALARKYNLRVIEDAAQAFGTYHHGKVVGATGDIVCFSFDGVKQVTSGEGGPSRRRAVLRISVSAYSPLTAPA